jgi:hypothetical protein
MELAVSLIKKKTCICSNTTSDSQRMKPLHHTACSNSRNLKKIDHTFYRSSQKPTSPSRPKQERKDTKKMVHWLPQNGQPAEDNWEFTVLSTSYYVTNCFSKNKEILFIFYLN